MLLLITLVVFVCLIRYLNKKLYIPLLEYMEKRDNDIKQKRDSASNNNAEIETLKQDAETRLVLARKEATSLKESIINEAKAFVENSIREKKEELEKKYLDFQNSLLTEKEELKIVILNDSSAIQLALKEKFATI
jgi:F-type H+-transporting ATPase subunit b